MKKYSKEKLVGGVLSLIVGLIVFLCASMVAVPAGDTQLAFILLAISAFLLIVGMIIFIRETERYIHGPPHG